MGLWEGERYYERPDIKEGPCKMGKCKLTGGYCSINDIDCRQCNVPIIRAIAGRGGTKEAQTIVRSWTLENMENGRCQR